MKIKNGLVVIPFYNVVDRLMPLVGSFKICRLPAEVPAHIELFGKHLPVTDLLSRAYYQISNGGIVRPWQRPFENFGLHGDWVHIFCEQEAAQRPAAQPRSARGRLHNSY